MRSGVVILVSAAAVIAAFFAGRQFSTAPELRVSVVEKTVTNTVEVVRTNATAEQEFFLARERAAALVATNVAAFSAATSAAEKVSGSPGATAVLNTKDAVLRAQMFAKLCDGMTANSAKEIMQSFLAKGFGTPRQEEEIRMLAERWASLDGKAAADFLQSIPHDGRPQNTLRATLAEWAMRDIDAAAAWARSQTTNAANPYMVGVIAGAANVNLSRAEQMLYDLPFGQIRGEAMAYVAGAHLENGNADAMNWALSVPDPRLQQASIRKVAAQVALTDPAGAANWVVQNSNAEQMENNVSQIARQWSYGAPEDAVNWALALPPGAAHDTAIAATLPALAERNQAAAEKILTSLPSSPATDQARVRIARDYAQTDPVRAIAWANTITEGHARDHVVQRVIEGWQQRDPQAAAKFLQTPATK